jgi:hypothetical protein
VITWIKKQQTYITSLIFWEKHYEPYQVIIFRWDYSSSLELIYYFKIDGLIISFPHKIERYRTKSEEEKVYHIARLGLMLLEAALEKIKNEEDTSSYHPPKNPDLDKILSEAFMSKYAIELLREKHPDFGYYSLSHNFKKLEKMILGQSYSLFEVVYKMIR